MQLAAEKEIMVSSMLRYTHALIVLQSSSLHVVGSVLNQKGKVTCAIKVYS